MAAESDALVSRRRQRLKSSASNIEPHHQSYDKDRSGIVGDAHSYSNDIWQHYGEFIIPQCGAIIHLLHPQATDIPVNINHQFIERITAKASNALKW